MKLKNLGHTFEQEPYLTTPIDRHLVETLKLQDFDKDGYEILTPLEKLHYEENKAEINQEIHYQYTPVKY